MRKKGKDMTDLCKCNDEDCTLKDKCYRYVCEADRYYQAYFAGTPREGTDCAYFIATRSPKE